MMMNAKYVRRWLGFIVAAAGIGMGAAQANPIDSFGHIVGQHEFTVNLNGVLDYDERGAETNIIQDYYLGPNVAITSLKWDVNVTTYGGSYLSEMQITFSDTIGNGITFTPGSDDEFDGTASYAGFQDFGAIDQIFQVGSDGLLRLEFHDAYKDLAYDEPEGIWNSGTLTFNVAEVPEPATYALILGGLALLTAARRRRQ